MKLKCTVFESGGQPKVQDGLETWDEVSEFILRNTKYEDSVFGVQDEYGKVIYAHMFDLWKENRFSDIEDQPPAFACQRS